MKLNVLGFPLQMDWLIKMLIQVLTQVLDKIIPGESLSDDQVKGVRTLWFLGHEWGLDAVADTETELDDDGLQAIFQLCQDTADEGKFSLPPIE